jgi:hypothetical protein
LIFDLWPKFQGQTKADRNNIFYEMIYVLDLHFKLNLGQKPKNIVKSLKIFICRTICARGDSPFASPTLSSFAKVLSS